MSLRLTSSLLLLAFCAPLMAQDTPPPAAPPTILGAPTVKKPSPFKTVDDKASYIFGVQIGRNLAQAGFAINFDALVAGMKHSSGGKDLLLTDQEMQAVMQEMQQRMLAKRAAEGKVRSQRGVKYLADNKTKPGVVALPSGLQYKIIKEGTGPKPKLTDTVVVHYHGTLTDGKVFDSSYQRGEPIPLQVNGVIEGWTEALQLMGVGSKWKLFIPSGLAYGERGQGEIGPNETLVFDVELLEIQK